MPRLVRCTPLACLSRAAVAGLLFAASGLVQAAFVPFAATVDGVSQILEAIDPNGPVVRVQTLAFGSGSPGALTYRSGDLINLGNGQGSGTNSSPRPMATSCTAASRCSWCRAPMRRCST